MCLILKNRNISDVCYHCLELLYKFILRNQHCTFYCVITYKRITFNNTQESVNKLGYKHYYYYLLCIINATSGAVIWSKDIIPDDI